MDLATVMARLQALADPAFAQHIATFGITPGQSLGIRVPEVRALAKEIRQDHALALELWGTGVHEARLLATMIADAKQVTEALMEQWVADFDTWDVCDQACSNLFVWTPFAYAKVFEWAGRSEEFVKRTGFAMVAYLATHDKKAPDEKMAQFFPLIVQHATNDRNFVKKAVNWALRDIGKRNLALNA